MSFSNCSPVAGNACRDVRFDSARDDHQDAQRSCNANMDGFTSKILPRERAGASFDVDALRRIITKGKDEQIAKYDRVAPQRVSFPAWVG